MSQLLSLDAMALTGWVRRAASELEIRREEINALNVFPVPDADTGSNMAHTMLAALTEVDRLDGEDQHDIALVSAALARGATLGARGNSGLVLSQVLRGIAQYARDEGVSGPHIKKALEAGYTFAMGAIAQPVEGTVITVLRAASVAANQTDDHDLMAIVTAATQAARRALERTPSQLQALRDAGVVDAGGQGLIVILESLCWIVASSRKPRHKETEISEYQVGVDTLAQLAGAQRVEEAPARKPVPRGNFGQPEGLAEILNPQRMPSHDLPASSPHEDMTSSYLEVMFMLRGCHPQVIRDNLEPLGDSVVIASLDNAGDAHRVHIHSHHAGKVIELAFALGGVSQLRLEALPDISTPALSSRVILAITPPGELAKLYERSGVQVVAVDSSADIVYTVVSAARATQADEIILLPNGFLEKAQLSAVERAGYAFEQTLLIVPTGAVVRGLAAVAVHDPAQPLAVDGYAMAEAINAMEYMRVRQADKARLTSVGACAKGDYLGVASRDIRSISDTFLDAIISCCRILIRDNTEQLTVLIDASMAAHIDHESILAALPKRPKATLPLELTLYIGSDFGSLAEIGAE
ncbi:MULTISPECIES: DAK2 domain-containing protein [unclassified Corynebacterium]|uniref:DAK2 domain-containing protein n=1 Tax=unclassified Corynebacterium TaxID=2624378 RepID=UPI00216925FB|nr:MULTISPECIES: DAK2 domain-containing protein [unclassified Corynebacterium]MCS4490726.1 DAK2 domain-containing protein [Corynebacterium sp. ES2775-CONJ]MCS4492528.1 DAK2 domain-containing protein [Corynebacterium sp. ES2715-CONJ3]MCS4532629.1 DAK2 domain-containing protein [Corynebacterium sp. ES2730-CONJ]